MISKKYKQIVEHYEKCLLTHGDNNLGVDWPNAEDVDKRYKVMLDIMSNDDRGAISLLDFGCGTADLLRYIREKGDSRIQYIGLDISDKFIEVSKRKYPSNEFICLDILEESPHIGTYDYVLMNGVFTEKRGLNQDEMWDYFCRMLEKVFEFVDVGLAFNVMSKNVDWEREDLFHVSHDTLTRFLCQRISRNYVIRNDYGLYEYTTYVYKK